MKQQETSGTGKKSLTGYLLMVMLVVLNIFLLYTVWSNHDSSLWRKKTISPPVVDHLETNTVRIEDFLRRCLHFSIDQVKRFRRMHAEHVPRANLLRKRLFDLREEIMVLLFNNNPDKSRIEKLSHDLGLAHEKLEKEIFFHFMELMALCAVEQRELFKRLLRSVFETYRPPAFPMESDVPGQKKVFQEGDTPRQKKVCQEGDALPQKRVFQKGETPRREGDPVERDLEVLQQRLNLTPQQRLEVEKVIRRLHQVERGIRQGKGGDQKSWRDRADQLIEEILTGQQKREFRKFKEETKKKPPPRRGQPAGG